MRGAGLERGTNSAHPPFRRASMRATKKSRLVPALCAVAKGLEDGSRLVPERALQRRSRRPPRRQSIKEHRAGEAKNLVDALGFLAPLHASSRQYWLCTTRMDLAAQWPCRMRWMTA